MAPYKCSECKLSTNLLGNYKRHLNTNKHKKNLKATGNKSPNNGKKNEISHNFHTISHNFHTISHKFQCEFCKKELTRNDSLKRHKLICKLKKEYDIKLLESKTENIELKQQINCLLKKVGTTNITTNNTNTNTNNNTIKLNCYGNEDLSHVSDTFKTSLLKMPYGMIPKLIEHVHFNKTIPENTNIKITNKKDKHIHIFANNKWEYHMKDDIINDIVDGKYFILDNHFDSLEDVELNKIQRNRYSDFRDKYDSSDDLLMKKLKRQCELILLNN